MTTDQPAAGTDVGRVLVVVPTYNEADNLAPIVARVRAAAPQVEILVADDASPDGTGALADRLAAADPQVHVLHRAGKQGLGAAYLAGFAWAAERGYDVVVEMDADGSHAPEQLPRLLAALHTADAVLGSRWVPGGRVVNWPWRRMLLSRGASRFTRLALGVPVRDVTGGYRAYRMPVLDKIDVDSVRSQGYCFQVELAWRAHQHGLRVVEVPITFTERERGASKMSAAIVREALWRVTVWGVRARGQALRQAVRRSRSSERSEPGGAGLGAQRRSRSSERSEPGGAGLGAQRRSRSSERSEPGGAELGAQRRRRRVDREPR